MSLSSLIVQREVATMRQVEEALARQVIYGGDLVTNLLEVARVDEGVLAPLLAQSMQLSAAPAGELPVVSEKVRALVPPELAAGRIVAPLAVEGRRLVLAVAEPMPADLEEQLGFALGMTIEQRVAPAVRVKQAIARMYGVPLERRMQRLIARMSGEPSTAGSMPPPLGKAPAVMEPPRPPSAPPLRHSTSRMAIVTAPAGEAVPPAAPPLSAPPPMPPEPEEERDSSLPLMPMPSERRTGLLQREVPQAVRVARRRRGPLTTEAAKSEAEEATDRDALLNLFFDYARQFFDYAAIFVVHGDIAEGRDAFGVGASRERLVGIGVPLDLPGLMANARDQRMPIVTKAPSDGLEAELLADLGRPRDAEIVLVPLSVRTRSVALFLGDCGDNGIERATVQQVVSFATVIGKAFERLIVRRKLDGFIAGSSKGATAGRVVPASVPPKAGSAKARSSAPPPVNNIAVVRPLSVRPIPREDPAESPAAAAKSAALQAGTAPADESTPDSTPVVAVEASDAEETQGLFDELGWESEFDESAAAPASAAIAVPPHRPPVRHTQRPSEASVIVDMDDELAALVERLATTGEIDEEAEGELLRQGERAMHALMARFPGPVTVDRTRLAVLAPPPRPSECGPILRLVVRERKVALPFILEKLSSQDVEERGWATHVLCELPYPEVIAPLLLRLRDVDLSTRVSAAHALASTARVYPEEVRGGVLGLARSVDPIDRAAAMRVMGELREGSLVPGLVRALADGDEAVVASAHASLVLVTRQDFGLDARPWLRWWDSSGTRHRIEWLIDALTHEVGEIRRPAGEELRALSKEYFGYTSDLPPRDRERSQQRYRDWWMTEGRTRFVRG